MEHIPMPQGRPLLAIVDSNTLATLGLKQILQNVMPIMTVETFGSFAELEANQPDKYVHYFVAMDIVLQERQFFQERRCKTIVLTLQLEDTARLSEFHSLCINQPEPQLIRQLLMLAQHAHGGGKNLPPMPQVLQQKILSDREIEVMSLIVQGYINKFGSDCVAGWACFNKIDQICLLPVQSLQMSTTTYVGQNYGAKNILRAKKGVWVSILISLILVMGRQNRDYKKFCLAFPIRLAPA